jgi:hypothetical protein
MNDEDLRVDDRCVTRCDHDSRCTLPDGHTPTDRHETEHGCICYDPRDKALNDALSGEADAVRRAESAEIGCEIAYLREPTQAEAEVARLREALAEMEKLSSLSRGTSVAVGVTSPAPAPVRVAWSVLPWQHDEDDRGDE